MTQEEKQLLLADLCGRLPYGVFVNIEGFDYDFNGKLVQVYFGNINRCSIQVGSNISYSLEETKPWLRPLSSMTEEEDKEFALLQVNVHRADILYAIDCTKVVEWLNKHHFDYRGLIGMGLAISTEEFNPYEK